MELSFSRRNAFAPTMLDLATLLARVSAAQAATPTARAQVQLDMGQHATGDADGRVALFAGPSAIDAPLPGASFAEMFRPRQLK